MKRTMIALVLVASLGLAAPASAHHDYDYGGGQYGGERGDQWNNEDRNRNRGRNRGAFSPGPFDDSPVDAFNGNVICLPGSTCYADPDRRDGNPPEQRQAVLACLLPVPYHCDPKPEVVT